MQFAEAPEVAYLQRRLAYVRQHTEGVVRVQPDELLQTGIIVLSRERLPLAVSGEFQYLLVKLDDGGTVTDADQCSFDSLQFSVKKFLIGDIECAGGFIQDRIARLLQHIASDG